MSKPIGFDNTSCDRSQVVRPAVVPCGSQIASVVKAEKFDNTSHDRSREALPLLSHYVTAIAPLPLGELRKAERG